MPNQQYKDYILRQELDKLLEESLIDESDIHCDRCYIDCHIDENLTENILKLFKEHNDATL